MKAYCPLHCHPSGGLLLGGGLLLAGAAQDSFPGKTKNDFTPDTLPWGPARRCETRAQLARARR